MENQSNPDFPLEQSASWNGAQIPIEIEPEGSGEVSPVQREAVRLIQSFPPDILDLAAPALMQNYETYREIYRGLLDDSDNPFRLPLARPADVWKQVHATRFFVPQHGEYTTPTFFLYAEIDWDVEHGLEVRFRNGVADAAGQQGDLGIED